MLLFLTHVLAAPVIGPVEPVLTHAKADRHHLNATPFYSMATASGPALFGLGHLSSTLSTRRSADTIEVGAAAVGLLTMGTMPSLLAQRANLSRKALQVQGLRPTRYPLFMTFVLTFTGTLTAGLGYAVNQVFLPDGERERWLLPAVGVGLWSLGVTLPILQLRANRRARLRAGWWKR